MDAKQVAQANAAAAIMVYLGLLCKCYDKYCTNVTRDTHDSLDDEDDE